jgi:hypothetical protein
MPRRSPRLPNHYVGEWFGQRIYPEVQLGEASLEAMRTQSCPFLTDAVGEVQDCIKATPSQGVCTITSKDARRYGVDDGSIDWLVCPYRTLDHRLLNKVAFDVAPEAALGGGATERLYADICRKMLSLWPELRRAVAADDKAPSQHKS